MKKTIKATIIDLIVALIIVGGIIALVFFIFGQKITDATTLINQVAIKTENKNEEVEININENKLDNYPEYGTQYATIEIPAIDVDLPVYYGDTMEILKNGVGHSSGSYFPGEGGSILYMGHNSKKVFRRFSELEKNDKITIKTNYGEYTYKIYDTKIIEETDLDEIPIQNNEEILMIYTCYPFNNIGYTKQRYVVYAKLEE